MTSVRREGIDPTVETEFMATGKANDPLAGRFGSAFPLFDRPGSELACSIQGARVMTWIGDPSPSESARQRGPIPRRSKYGSACMTSMKRSSNSPEMAPHASQDGPSPHGDLEQRRTFLDALLAEPLAPGVAQAVGQRVLERGAGLAIFGRQHETSRPSELRPHLQEPGPPIHPVVGSPPSSVRTSPAM